MIEMTGNVEEDIRREMKVNRLRQKAVDRAECASVIREGRALRGP